MQKQDPYVVPGLVRGLSLLQTFTPQKPEQTLKQLAESLGVTRSTIFRAVHTLVQEGFLLPVRDGHHYQLGPAVLRLSYGYLASRELLEVAQTPLEMLRDKVGWSSHLGVLDGRHTLYLISLPASENQSSFVQVGSRLPAISTAMGRILLVQKTEAELRKLIADQPQAVIRNTLKSWESDQRAKVVIHLGSFQTGLSSVAAPIYDSSGTIIAAISATKHAGKVKEKTNSVVLRTAETISRGLGWKGEETTG